MLAARLVTTEISKADDFHFVARLQGVGNRVERRVDRLAGARFRHAGPIGDCRDEIVLVHVASLSLIRAGQRIVPPTSGGTVVRKGYSGKQKRRNTAILIDFVLTPKRRRPPLGGRHFLLNIR
jgi:hypothetical protein